jgi:hypothetical protein
MFFGALAFLTGETYKANANTAEASAAAAEKIKHELKAAEKQLHREVVRAEAKLSHELHAAERKLGAEVKADERRIAHLRPQVAHATHAVDVALPRDIAGLRKRNETLSRDQAKLKERTGALEDGALDTWKWIRTHPLAATTGVFAGAVAIALQRFGLGNLRCRNFTNLLKHYGCGFGTLLARLLPLAVLLAVAFDFPDFVRASRVVAAGIGDAVQKLEGQFDPHLPPLPPPRG